MEVKYLGHGGDVKSPLRHRRPPRPRRGFEASVLRDVLAVDLWEIVSRLREAKAADDGACIELVVKSNKPRVSKTGCSICSWTYTDPFLTNKEHGIAEFEGRSWGII